MFFFFFPFFYPSFFGYYFSFSCLNPFLFDAAFRIFFLRVFVSLLFPLFFIIISFSPPSSFLHPPFPLYLLFFSLLPRGWRSSNIYLLIFLLSDFSPFFFVLLLVVFPFFFFPSIFFSWRDWESEGAAKKNRKITAKYRVTSNGEKINCWLREASMSRMRRIGSCQLAWSSKQVQRFHHAQFSLSF